MRNSIIQTGQDYLKSNPQIFLKVNALLKGMNFKEVHIASSLKPNHYCEELTLYINPQIEYSYRRQFYMEEETIQSFRNKKGFLDPAKINQIINYDDVIEPIRINNQHLGDYYPDRNFVILFYPIYLIDFKFGVKNEFLFYFLNEFGKEIERIKPVVRDVSKLQREELVNQFLQEIKKSIVRFKSELNNKLDDVEKYRRLELTYLGESKQIQEQINTLKGTYKCMGENIETKIEEIKKLPFVKRVGISNLGIRVDFQMIHLEWQGRKVELGECYCYLNPSSLKIENKNKVTFNGDFYHHPHISNTSICFGSGENKAYDLLASLKFKELVYFIYLYLKTYNEGDTYLSVSNWEKCKENGGVYDGDEDENDEGDDYDE